MVFFSEDEIAIRIDVKVDVENKDRISGHNFLQNCLLRLLPLAYIHPILGIKTAHFWAAFYI
jgi:hypothetical protein